MEQTRQHDMGCPDLAQSQLDGTFEIQLRFIDLGRNPLADHSNDVCLDDLGLKLACACHSWASGLGHVTESKNVRESVVGVGNLKGRFD